MNTRSSTEILRESKSIAVVGVSEKVDRPSYQVAEYLLKNTDYRIFFVNPTLTTLFGEKVYANLADLVTENGPIDIVDVFRKVEELPGLFDEARMIGAKVFWMQLGLRDETIEAMGSSIGIDVIQDECIRITHQQL